MSLGVAYLHSHSGLERELRYPKNKVLVDERYIDLFSGIAHEIKKVKYKNVKFIEVPILAFVHKGGTFKNLDA